MMKKADAGNNDETGIAEIDVQMARNKKSNDNKNIFTNSRAEDYQNLVKVIF